MSTLKADIIQSTSGGAATLTKQAGIKMSFKTASVYASVNSDSLNVSGLVDNATGDVTINFTNSFTTNNYSTTASCLAATGKIATFTGEQTGSMTYRAHTDAGADSDNNMAGMAAGDLA